MIREGRDVPIFRFSIAMAVFLVVAGTVFGAGGIEPEDIDESGAVYDYLHWRCTVQEDGYRLHTSGKITIYNVRGESHSDIVISEHGSEKLQRVVIRAIDADGKELFVREKDDLERYCGFGQYAVYKDICHYASSIEVPQFPFSIVFEYEKTGKSLFLWPAASLQREIPVKRADYLIEGTDKVSFRYRLSGLKGDTAPEVTETSWEWRFDDIPAYPDPEYAAYGYGEPASLVFVPERFEYEGSRFEGDSWSDIARWYHMLAEDKYSPPKEKVYTRRIRDTLAFIKEAYDEVTSSVRYVAVQIGIGGWQPYEAKKTYERKYGDCKDMSTLLISLLRNRGIEVYPALVLTRGAGAVDVDFPSFRFNHVICCAIHNEDTIWMDPTCSNCPFGELRWAVEGIPALIVTENGGGITRTPAGVPDDNRLTIETDLHIAPDNRADASLSLAATGNRAVYLRGRLSGESEEETWTFLKSYLPGLSGPYELDNLLIEHLYEADSCLTIAIDIRRKKPFRKIGSTVYVEAFPFCKGGGMDDVDLEDRDVPLQPLYPCVTHSACRITFDQVYGVDSVVIPDETSARFDFGELHSSVSADGPEITTQYEKTYYPGKIDCDQFDDFSAWRKAFRDLEKQYVKIYR